MRENVVDLDRFAGAWPRASHARGHFVQWL